MIGCRCWFVQRTESTRFELLLFSLCENMPYQPERCIFTRQKNGLPGEQANGLQGGASRGGNIYNLYEYNNTLIFMSVNYKFRRLPVTSSDIERSRKQ